MTKFETALAPQPGGCFEEPVKIYTGLLGQIGDIIMFTAVARRIKEIFPNSSLTYAVSERYREAGELVAGLPYVDKLFVTKNYYELRSDITYAPWHLGWPCELRGEDEIAEQSRHDIVLETRPRHRRMPWWEYDHQVAELAHMVGVPGPINLTTEIAVPDDTTVLPHSLGRIVMQNDPSIDQTKAWPWENALQFIRDIGPENVVLLGTSGPHVPGVLDLRGRTTLTEAAAVIAGCRCYVGIDSGLMWIAGSLHVPTIGLYGTSYIAAYDKIQPVNPRAIYLQTTGTLHGISAGDVKTALNAIPVIK